MQSNKNESMLINALKRDEERRKKNKAHGEIDGEKEDKETKPSVKKRKKTI